MEGISWSGFTPDELVLHKNRLATVTVVPLECVSAGLVPIRYKKEPVPYAIVSADELTRIQ